MLFAGRHFYDAGGCGDFGLGDKHLRYEDGAGSCHDDGGEEVGGVDAVGDVSSHDAAGDVSHAGGHDGHEFGVSGVGEEGPDGEGGFGLAHEDAGGDVGGLGSGDAHGLLHDPREGADDELHEADVIEDGEEGRDEDDGGEDLEGEDGERGVVAEWAEDHGGAGDGVGQELVDAVACGGEDALADGGLEDNDGEDNLKAETPRYRAPLDGAAVSGEGVSEREKGEESEKTGETCQRGALRRLLQRCDYGLSVTARKPGYLTDLKEG